MKIKLDYIVKSFRIPSKDNTHWHTIDLWNDGKLTCDCEAGTFNRYCHHRKIAEDYIKNKKEEKEK